MSSSVKISKKNSAISRILKDIQEIKSTPLKTVFAEPLENNLFTWHVNIIGDKDSDYPTSIIHLILEIPEDYPFSPPKIKLLTPLNRSHVYGEWICLDMLQTHYTNELYSGWSTGYTLLSILLQLQSFLMKEDEDLKSWGSKENQLKREKCIDFSKTFKCLGCSHDMSKNQPFPYLQIEKEEKIEKMELPTEMLVQVFSFLTLEESKKIILNSSMSKISYLNERKETICFHSKKSFEEEMLGYGIDANFKFGKLKSIDSPLDLISKSSFEEGVRMGVWREKFSSFLPLFINEKHGIEALKEAEIRISLLFSTKEFNPRDALSILSSLMNTQVVNIMNGNRFASIKAMEGYAQFHRLLIAFCQKYPILLRYIDERVLDFIKNDNSRSKDALPSIGDFITLLSVSTHKWKQVSPYILKETFVRNILWITKSYPKIFKNGTKDSQLVKLAFETNKVSMKLLMFHEYFLNSFAKVNELSLNEVAKNYDHKYGRPSVEDKENLQKAVTRIQSVQSFEDAFKSMKIEMKMPIADILRTARTTSLKKNYHKE
jgi:ubiquitin-protein ligase